MLDLTTLKTMVDGGMDLTQEARQVSERARDYYDGYQLTAAERAALNARRQPVVIDNRVKRKIDAMVGIEQRGRTDPRAYPREPGDEEAADIATKALVFVEETERVDVKRSMAFENLLIEGYGGVEVCMTPERGQRNIKIKPVRWEEIVYDGHSREKDFSDASFIGVLKWMTKDAARQYAGQFYDGEDLDDLLDSTIDGASTGETFEDRPQNRGVAWADPKHKRIRVAQIYYLSDGVWHMAVFTGRGELFNQVSPYLDEHGEPTCSIKLMSAYVDRENRRYGLVKDMFDQQDEINKRRSKLLAQLSNRQTIGVKGALDSVASMKRELAAPDGHVSINMQAFEDAVRAGVRPFEIVQNADQTSGQFALLQESKQAIDNLGPNASLLGQLSGQQSGRAIMAQQQAGLAELAPIYDSLRDWTERLYRQIWAAIKQFWDGPRWIRVTENEGAPEFIGINQPVMTEFGMQLQNPIGQIDVDIIIDQAPEYATLRAEQFDKLATLAGLPGMQIPPRLLIEASDLRDKKRLLEMLDGDPQMAQQQSQIQQRGIEAELSAVEAKARRDMAEAALTEAEIPKMQAEASEAQDKAVASQVIMQRAAQRF